MKKLLIESIHNLIYHNIYCSNPNDSKWAGIAANGYEKRLIGFRSEIELKRKFAGKNVFDGGWMLSIQTGKRCIDNSIYFTISKDLPEKYINIYKMMTKLKFIRMFFIHYDSEEFFKKHQTMDILGIGIEIPYPNFTFYEFKEGKFEVYNKGSLNLDGLTMMFQKKSNRYKATYKLNHEPFVFANSILSGYTEDELLGLLVNRFIFDGVLGFGYYRGIPSDIDVIIENETGNKLIEVKEKDRAKTIEGFGMDTARMNDIIYISDILKTPYYYYVMEVNNQKERKFLGWWSIDIHNFYKFTKGQEEIEGGTGMATATEYNHPTLVCPIKNFDKVIF